MSEKVEFTGDVGQAVMGDVKEAPRLNNVVTLNMGKEEPPPVPTIIDFQRSRISQLVKDLAAMTGDHTLDIYRVIFTEFGIEKIRELPRDRYKEAVALIDKWIIDAKDATQPKPLPPQAPAVVSSGQNAEHCARCEEKDLNFARQQKTNFAQWVLIVILACSSGWLLYKMPDSSDGASHLTENKCYFDGKAYSAGSTVRNVTGSLQECGADDPAMQVKWMTAHRTK